MESNPHWLLREYRREYPGYLPAPDTVYRGVELGAWLAAAADVEWHMGFELLCDFVEANGRVPAVEESWGGHEIGAWANGQRALGQRALPERIAALSAIPGWVWDINTAAWWARYCLLRDFAREHERMPTQREVYSQVKLGLWVENQCRAHRGQGTCRLTPEREAYLESVPGWVWEAQRQSPHDWHEGLELLHDFAKRHGRVPAEKETWRGQRIGRWCAEQRRVRHDPASAAALGAVPGWTWDGPEIASWQEWYDLLSAFVKEHQRLPRRREAWKGRSIGWWIGDQRRSRKRGRRVGGRLELTPSRVAKLEAIRGWKW